MKDLELSRKKRALIGSILLCAGLLWLESAAGVVVVYDEDFSSDPGWSTDQPDNFYWDAVSQAYFARTVNGRPEYAPNRYAYSSVALDPGQPFDLEWDQKILSAGIGSRSLFGLMSPDLLVHKVTWYSVPHLIPESAVNFWMGAWVDPMPGDSSAGVNAIDASGYNVGFGSYSGAGGHYSLDQWYRNALRYDPLADSIDWSITERDSGNLIASGVRTFPTSVGFSSQMVNLGVGNDPFGYQPNQLSTVNPDEYAEALFDNILLTMGDTAPPERDIYGLFIGARDDSDSLLGVKIPFRGDSDATRLFETISSNVADFRRADSKLLTRDLRSGEGLSYKDIEEAFDEIRPKVGPEDTFIFFASSHGDSQDDDGGETPPNCGDEYLSLGYALYDDELKEFLKAFDPATEKWVFLDSCHSGGFWGDNNQQDVGDLEKLSNISLMAAAGEDGSAYHTWDHGLFSRALTDAFGDLASEPDGIVTFDELAESVKWPDWLSALDGTVVYESDFGDPVVFASGMWSPASYASDDFTGSFEVIPAPSSVILAGIGIGLVGWLRRRRTGGMV